MCSTTARLHAVFHVASRDPDSSCRTQAVGSHSALILTHWTTPRRFLWCLPQKVSFPTSAVIPSPFTPSCLESSCLARRLSLTENFWPLCYHPVMSHEGRRNSLGKGSVGVRIITSHGGSAIAHKQHPNPGIRPGHT